MGRLLLIVLFAFLTFSTVLAEKPREAVRKGIDLYHDKEYDRALAEFMAARQDAPDREELDYDLGAALYKLEKYPEAMGAFAKVLEKEEPELAADAWYNLGNTLARSEKFEESLAVREEYFTTIFEESPLGVALIDSLTGHIYEVNRKFADIAGRSLDEMATIDWMSITHPDDIQEDLDNMAALNSGKINGFNMEKRYIRKGTKMRRF